LCLLSMGGYGSGLGLREGSSEAGARFPSIDLWRY
jgi:hypothetical protein